MEFKIGSEYTRDEIHTLYHGGPVKGYGGNWRTGYVREGEELIVFMNIDVPGTTGHDFENKYDSEKKIIEWFGKPGTHSEQPIFKKLLSKELTPHFFARWDDNTNPLFTYLGVGNVLTIQDGHPTKNSNGESAETVKLTLSFSDAGDIIPMEEPEVSFGREKYLEEFIVDNWDNLDLGKKYRRYEEEVDGKRKKFRAGTGEIDILALSKDESEFLVIELKKGRTTYSVVGQIQVYMGYIRKNVAKPNQRVKGLIIAPEEDENTGLALSINPDISFNRYRVNFELIGD